MCRNWRCSRGRLSCEGRPVEGAQHSLTNLTIFAPTAARSDFALPATTASCLGRAMIDQLAARLPKPFGVCRPPPAATDGKRQTT